MKIKIYPITYATSLEVDQDNRKYPINIPTKTDGKIFITMSHRPAFLKAKRAITSPKIKSGNIAPTDNLAGITRANKPTGIVAAAGTDDLAKPMTNTAKAAIRKPPTPNSSGKVKFK